MILQQMSLTGSQLISTFLAIPAFVPATVCTGYLFAWLTNLHGFRMRSLVERVFWSIPASLAVSTIASVLVGKFFSLGAVVILLLASAFGSIFVLANELRNEHKTRKRRAAGLQPLGSKALILVILWTVFTIFSLVDIHRDHELFMNVSMLDQSARVLWTESVLHTGVPPVNQLYLYKHTVPMRNYYFWYVVCAAISRMTGLRARSVFTASCVWAGFGLVSLLGLYLKHFLAVGPRLRRQFLYSVGLVTVTGLDIAVVLWNLLRYRIPPPADLEAWSRDGIVSWLHTIFWAPHHLVSMICCMFAFLLAWMDAKECSPRSMTSAILIALAIASAFGLSVYVTFAFFLAMVGWAVWQVAIERTWRASALLAAGGAASVVLLLPYLLDLLYTPSQLSKSSSTAGGSLFSFAVRQMIPPDRLLASELLQNFAHTHPDAAANLARLIWLLPGYMLELGFFFVVFLVYLIPALRRRAPLTDAQRSLLFLACVTVPITSFIRSGVLQTNDFAWRSALFVQFPLLLLGSDLLMSWSASDGKLPLSESTAGLPGATPRWLRGVASFALIIGVLSTVCQALIFRFLIPISDMHTVSGPAPEARNLSQKAYISAIGYAQLNAVIPRNAVVQYNPEDQGRDRMSMIVNLLGIDHQSVISSDSGSCGSDLGGDPTGCPILAAAIDALYNGASADQARAACHQWGIQYLVARVYDPVWKDRNGWVWTLKPVVADEDFRALDCGH
jgi:hypothetical protein